MRLNPELTEIFRARRIDKNIGLMYLLTIYHKIENEVIPEDIKKQVAATKIIERDYNTGTLTWNLPLYEGQEIAFEWVKAWNDQFGEINPARQADIKSVVKRMKEFFAENPEVRKEDVINATNLYFSELESPTFIKYSNRFIYEGSGAVKSSLLAAYVSRIKQNNNQTNNNKDNEGYRGQVFN